MQQGRGLKLNNSSNNRSDDANFIQRLLEAQNKRIDYLVDRIRQQQDKLKKQNMHLQALQGEVKQRREVRCQVETSENSNEGLH